MKLETVLSMLGAEMPTENFISGWDASQRLFPGGNKLFFLTDDFIRQQAAAAALDGATVDYLLSRREQCECEAAARLLWYEYHLLYDDENWPDLSPSQFPELSDENMAMLMNLILALSGIPQAVKKLAAIQIPENIQKDTFSDLAVWVEFFKEERSSIGITLRILDWLQSHLHGKIFRLGRLQFNPYANFPDDIAVYRNIKNGKVQALAAPGCVFNAEGQYDGADGAFAVSGTWVSYLAAGKDFKICGNPVNPGGFAENRHVELDLREWHKVLGKGDHVLDIHIPAIGAMTVAACADSIARAVAFFPRYFPDLPFKGFICSSWFLDNQYEKILKPDANILQFQHAGYLFPCRYTCGEEAVWRVFGEKGITAGIENVPWETSMQKAVGQFVKSGGRLRSGAMFLLKEDLPWGGSPYRDWYTLP